MAKFIKGEAPGIIRENNKPDLRSQVLFLSILMCRCMVYVIFILELKFEHVTFRMHRE